MGLGGVPCFRGPLVSTLCLWWERVLSLLQFHSLSWDLKSCVDSRVTLFGENALNLWDLCFIQSLNSYLAAVSESWGRQVIAYHGSWNSTLRIIFFMRTLLLTQINPGFFYIKACKLVSTGYCIHAVLILRVLESPLFSCFLRVKSKHYTTNVEENELPKFKPWKERHKCSYLFQFFLSCMNLVVLVKLLSMNWGSLPCD